MLILRPTPGLIVPDQTPLLRPANACALYSGKEGAVGREVRAPLLPANLRVWLDPSDLSTMFQERTGAAATTPAVVGSRVRSIRNKGTLGGWAQAVDTVNGPFLRQDADGCYYLEAVGAADQLVFQGGMGNALVGERHSIAWAARWPGTGTVLGGQGTTQNENFHTGFASGGALFNSLFDVNFSAGSGWFNKRVVMVGQTVTDNRYIRANGVDLAGFGHPDTATNGGLQLFDGPVSAQAGLKLFFGLMIRHGNPVPRAEREADEQLLAYNAGIIFTSTSPNA